MTNIPKLPESELEIMIIVWEKNLSVTCDYIMETLDNNKNWSKTTVLSFLSRLVDRGFLSVEKENRKNQYTPIVKEGDYLKQEGKSFLRKMCHNSVTDFVATLYQNNDISKDDLDDLKKLIEEMK